MVYVYHHFPPSTGKAFSILLDRPLLALTGLEIKSFFPSVATQNPNQPFFPFNQVFLNRSSWDFPQPRIPSLFNQASDENGSLRPLLSFFLADQSSVGENHPD